MSAVPVAMLVNAPSPYRIAVNTRIAREVPEVRLITAFMWDRNIQAWERPDYAGFGGVQYGAGEPFRAHLTAATAWHEWCKGGRICRDLERDGVRAVITSGYMIPSMLRVLLWAWSRDIPTFIWSDSNSRTDKARGFRRAVKEVFVGSIVRRLTGVLPSGTRGREYYLRYGGADESMFFFPLEPDEAAIRGLPAAEVAAIAARFGLSPGRKRIVISGRLSPEKAIDVGLRAFFEIAGERPEWDLVLAGDGPQEAELRAMIPGALRDRVIFTGFVASATDLAGIYRASEILLHPARRDAWAVVIEEAVLAGMAVVASDIAGAIADQVLQGVNGVIFRPENVAEAAAALRLATRGDVLPRLRANATTVIESWRSVFDPVNGFRAAMAHAGLPVDPGHGLSIAASMGRLRDHAAIAATSAVIAPEAVRVP